MHALLYNDGGLSVDCFSMRAVTAVSILGKVEDMVTFRGCEGGCLGCLTLFDGFLSRRARFRQRLLLEAVYEGAACHAGLCQHRSPRRCCMPSVFCSITGKPSVS